MVVSLPDDEIEWLHATGAMSCTVGCKLGATCLHPICSLLFDLYFSKVCGPAHKTVSCVSPVSVRRSVPKYEWLSNCERISSRRYTSGPGSGVRRP